jgi:hypothetical protein
MHDAIIAGAFLLMLIAPCLISMRSGATNE